MQLQRRDNRNAWLSPPGWGTETLVLPRAELPADARDGEDVDVFVYLDSEDQPVATTRAPHLRLGEVAFLTVSDVTRFGAFVDWGLPKDLLVPFAEQTRDLACGDREPFGLLLDKSDRLVATMRVAELLRGRANVQQNQWVAGEAWRNDPDIGLFVIFDRAFVGLVPAHEPHSLRRGDVAKFRVSQVLPDGKVELSLRGLALDEIENDARHVLEQLSIPGSDRLTERADPETIRVRFGMSKKAFKRAVGRLLKDGAVVFDERGFITPTRSVL